jgi:threonine/homoserine/homoserine lactone efflux protein
MDYYIPASFLLATLVFLITPGPVVAMVTHNTLRNGAQAGAVTAISAELGKTCLIGILYAGLTISGRFHPGLFRWLSLAAALYLVWRAAHTLRCRYLRLGKRATAGSSRPIVDGLAVGFGNPTALAFFAAFLPQFMTAGDSAAAPVFRLGASYLCTALIFHAVLILALSSIRIPAGRSRIGGLAEVGSVAAYLVIAAATTVDFLRTAG